ncbi:hypothetical protein PRIC1_005835 [Phytophthora ramorum]
MACTSPNQWAQTSPTASSSSRGSRLHLTSGDRQDEASDIDALEEHATGDDALLDHVRQLIIDLLVDDAGQRSSSFRPSDAVTEGGRDAKRHSNNPETEEDARERLLEEKLARVLVELAGEQDNLRLAANAGNALLEELGTAREEIDALHDELEAARLDGDRAARDTRRLREQNAALETELQRYDAPYGSWDSAGQQNALSHHQQQQQRRPSLTSRSGSFSRTDSCERCASREVEVTQLGQRTDELRRRCLELELAREKDQQRERELGEEIAQLQQRSHEQHLETGRVQDDLDFVTTQLTQRAEEVESVQAVRDTLRRTARRLEAENEELRERLAARDEFVGKLENSKARAATQLQVAENRTKSAQTETKRVTEALQQLQKQLEHALLQQRQSGRGDSSERGDDEAELKPQAKEDMDQLLQDATREVAALRLENRVLRRQNSADASSEGNRTRGRRRKTMCTGSAAMTAADVLALGKREKNIATASSDSDSGGDTTQASTALAQLSPLAIDSIEQTAGGSISPSNRDETKRRQMSLELKTAMNITDSYEEKSTALSVPSGELWSVNENNIGDEQQGEVESSMMAMPPSTAKRPTAISRLSHVTDDCVISGATDSNSPEVRLYGMEGQSKRRPTVGDADQRARDLAIDGLRRDAAESPPKSPLYFGLSFIACATAATAAGLLVRR